MKNSLVLFITIFFSLPLCAAEEKKKPMCDSDIASLLKMVISPEPHAMHPGNGWNTGLGTVTLAALARVNKLCYALCQSLIDAPRKKIVKQHKQRFTIEEKSILCNQFGQWAGIGRENQNPNAWYIFFGNESHIHCIKNNYNQCDKIKNIPKAIIDSCDIEYHDEYDNKKHRAAFLIQENDYLTWNYSLGNVLLIIPDEKQVFGISLKLDQKEHLPYTALQNLRKTTAHLLHKTFSLSEDPSFWNARYSHENALSIERNIGEHTRIILNPTDPFFKDCMHNYYFLRNFLTNQCTCRCDTQHIDPACATYYHDVLTIAREENAYNLAKGIHNHFITHHIVHEIKERGNSSLKPTSALYTNALNKLLIKKDENKPMETIRLYTKSCSGGGSWDPPSARETIVALCEAEYKPMQVEAEKNAAKWQRMNNVIFYEYKGHNDANRVFYASLTKKKRFKSACINGNNFEIDAGCSIQSAHQLIFGKGEKPIVIFTVHDALKNAYKLIFCIPFGCHAQGKDTVYKCSSLNALKKNFNFLMSYRSDNGCKNRHLWTIEANKDDVDNMLLYLHTLGTDFSALTTEPEDTSSLLQFKHISTLEYDFYRDKKMKFTPTHWLDKIWYGTSACSIYSTQNKDKALFTYSPRFAFLQHELPMFTLSIGLVGSVLFAFNWCWHPLGIFINTLINDFVYDVNKNLTPTIDKALWGSRITAVALFARLGNSLFSGVAPRIGCALIPVLNLGLHAYKMNSPVETVEIPFHHLYNSWPAQLRRLCQRTPEDSSS